METSILVIIGETSHGKRLKNAEKLNLKTLKLTFESFFFVDNRSCHSAFILCDHSFVFATSGFFNQVHRFDTLRMAFSF
jgi:hypothetical protein